MVCSSPAFYIIDPYNMALCALVTIAMQTIFFILATCCKFDKVIEIAAAGNFIFLALLTLLIPWTFGARQIAVTVLVVFWGVRLSVFLLYRIIKGGENKCFDDMRGKYLKFASFWIFQAVWVFTVSLPVIFINAGHNDDGSYLCLADIIGILFFVFGLIAEIVFDLLKFCNAGRQQCCPHLNYWAEIILWLGIFIMSACTLNCTEWVAALGPIFITSILLFVSLVSMLEQKADVGYESQEAYKELFIGTRLVPNCFLPCKPVQSHPTEAQVPRSV